MDRDDAGSGDSSGIETQSQCNGATPADGGMCPTKPIGTLTIIGTTYSVSGSTITYGTPPALWDVYTFAGPGQSVPRVTPNPNALAITAALTRPAVGQAWAGVGVSIDGTTCVSESDPANYGRGLLFTLSGDLGGCALYLDAVVSPDESSASDPCRGTCAAGVAACVAPSVQIAPQTSVNVSQTGMVTVQNGSFYNGSPAPAPETNQLIGFRWRLQTPEGSTGIGCSADITISNVQLFGL